MGRHEVGRFDRAQAHDPFVGAAVAHDAHGLHREEDHEGLAHLVVEAGVAEFFDEDRVGFTEKVGVFALHFAEDAHAQTRTREGVTVDHFSGKAEFDAEFADFVLEEVAQRFEELQVKRVGKTAHVVVRLDGLRLLRLGAGGFDDVRIDRALGEPLGLRELGSFFLEDFHEFAADDLALLFGVGDARERVHEAVHGVDDHELEAHVLFEGFADLFAFVLAKEAVVDEDAGELLADGAVDEGRGDRAVDAAREAENDFFFADLIADLGDGFGDVVAHDPVGVAAADVEDEALEHGAALDGVGHFGVELQGVEAAFFVAHAGDRARRRRAHDLEARGQFGDLVAVAHPDLEHAVAVFALEVFDAFKKTGVVVGAHFGVAEFALGARLDLAAELLGHRLHAVADAEDGNARGEDGFARLVVRFFIGAHVRAREDDALRVERADEVGGDVVGMNFAVDVGFAHAAGDELRHLAAEVENENAVVRHGCVGPKKGKERPVAEPIVQRESAEFETGETLAETAPL